MNRRQFNFSIMAAGLAAIAGPAAAAPKPSRWGVSFELRHPADINVEHIDYSPQYRILASWATDGSLQILNTSNRSAILSRNGGCTLAGIQGQKLTYIDEREVKILSLKDLQTTPFRAVLPPNAISPNGEWWAGVRDEKFPAVWNLRKSRLATLGVPQAFYRAENRFFTFSGDSKWVAVAQGVRAFLFDLSKPDDPIQIPDQGGEVTCMRLSRDGRVLILGAMGGTVNVYDRLAGKSLRTVSFEGDVRALAIDQSKSLILVGTSDGANPLASFPWPNPKDARTLLADPVIWETGGQTWSCWLSGDTAITGHRAGKLKVWKLSH